jgi:hypothetical protein
MSANYIGAIGRVNIGQFDVKRLAQNGCVETNQSSPKFAFMVDCGVSGRYSARPHRQELGQNYGALAIAAWNEPHKLPEAAGLPRAGGPSFAVKMHHQKGNIRRRDSADATGLR